MGCFPFIRLMMFLLNLFIFLSGLTLLVTGTWVSVNSNMFLRLLGPFSDRILQFVNINFLFISLGVLLLLLGLLGSCGAKKESKCLLITFFSIILIIFITQVAAGVVALAYSFFAEEILKWWSTPALQNQYGRDPEVTKIWNSTMTEFKCCGFYNYTDFVGSKFEEQNGGELPPSCCWTNLTPCSPAEAAHTPVQGCFEPILEILREHTNAVGGISAGIGVLEISALIISMYLYVHLDNSS